MGVTVTPAAAGRNGWIMIEINPAAPPWLLPGRPLLLVGPVFPDEMSESHADNLRLTDFLDLQTLQEIQDSFAAVADVKAVITDAEGNLLTQPTPTTGFLRRQRALAEAARLSPDY